jgi:Spy/CpxP family protein refolding chaperone
MLKGVTTMKKFTLITLAVVLALAIASQAMAFNGGYGRGRGGGSCFQGDVGNVAGLNLSDEQNAKIRDLRAAQLKEMQPLQEKMFSKRGELRQLWLQKNPDENKIKAAHRDIRALRDQMQDKMLSNRLAMFKVLTPEQQTKLQASYGGRGFGCSGMGGYGKGPRGNW